MLSGLMCALRCKHAMADHGSHGMLAMWCQGFFLFTDAVLAIGLLILLVAIPSGFVKWRKMVNRPRRRLETVLV